MREFAVDELRKALRRMCEPLAMQLPCDVEKAIREAEGAEDSPIAAAVLNDLLENAKIAREEGIPICQDTGVAVIFLEVGLDVHFDGNPYEALEEGVREGYKDFSLRKSVVADPLRRVNTGDNTPPFVTVKLVPGDKVKITLLAKGFGSENMSRLKMLRPADGLKGVKDFVLETVAMAGPNACPPFVIGIGIGGTFDKVALAAKHALTRKVGTPNSDPYYADLENDFKKSINELGVGPQGFGGRTTTLAVAIEAMPTHIAGLPVAVNINCHVTRHVEVIL